MKSRGPRRPVKNPRSLVERGKDERWRGLAFDAPSPGEAPTTRVLTSPWFPVDTTVVSSMVKEAASDPAILAWFVEDTKETEACARAVLVARGEPDPAAWFASWRAAQAEMLFGRPPILGTTP